MSSRKKNTNPKQHHRKKDFRQKRETKTVDTKTQNIHSNQSTVQEKYKGNVTGGEFALSKKLCDEKETISNSIQRPETAREGNSRHSGEGGSKELDDATSTQRLNSNAKRNNVGKEGGITYSDPSSIAGNTMDDFHLLPGQARDPKDAELYNKNRPNTVETGNNVKARDTGGVKIEASDGTRNTEDLKCSERIVIGQEENKIIISVQGSTAGNARDDVQQPSPQTKDTKYTEPYNKNEPDTIGTENNENNREALKVEAIVQENVGNNQELKSGEKTVTVEKKSKITASAPANNARNTTDDNPQQRTLEKVTEKKSEITSSAPANNASNTTDDNLQQKMLERVTETDTTGGTDTTEIENIKKDRGAKDGETRGQDGAGNTQDLKCSERIVVGQEESKITHSVQGSTDGNARDDVQQPSTQTKDMKYTEPYNKNEPDTIGTENNENNREAGEVEAIVQENVGNNQELKSGEKTMTVEKKRKITASAPANNARNATDDNTQQNMLSKVIETYNTEGTDVTKIENIKEVRVAKEEETTGQDNARNIQESKCSEKALAVENKSEITSSASANNARNTTEGHPQQRTLEKVTKTHNKEGKDTTATENIKKDRVEKDGKTRGQDAGNIQDSKCSEEAMAIENKSEITLSNPAGNAKNTTDGNSQQRTLAKDLNDKKLESKERKDAVEEKNNPNNRDDNVGKTGGHEGAGNTQKLKCRTNTKSDENERKIIESVQAHGKNSTNIQSSTITKDPKNTELHNENKVTAVITKNNEDGREAREEEARAQEELRNTQDLKCDEKTMSVENQSEIIDSDSANSARNTSDDNLQQPKPAKDPNDTDSLETENNANSIDNSEKKTGGHEDAGNTQELKCNEKTMPDVKGSEIMESAQGSIVGSAIDDVYQPQTKDLKGTEKCTNTGRFIIEREIRDDRETSEGEDRVQREVGNTHTQELKRDQEGTVDCRKSKTAEIINYEKDRHASKEKSERQEDGNPQDLKFSPRNSAVEKDEISSCDPGIATGNKRDDVPQQPIQMNDHKDIPANTKEELLIVNVDNEEKNVEKLQLSNAEQSKGTIFTGITEDINSNQKRKNFRRRFGHSMYICLGLFTPVLVACLCILGAVLFPYTPKSHDSPLTGTLNADNDKRHYSNSDKTGVSESIEVSDKILKKGFKRKDENFVSDFSLSKEISNERLTGQFIATNSQFSENISKLDFLSVESSKNSLDLNGLNADQVLEKISTSIDISQKKEYPLKKRRDKNYLSKKFTFSMDDIQKDRKSFPINVLSVNGEKNGENKVSDGTLQIFYLNYFEVVLNGIIYVIPVLLITARLSVLMSIFKKMKNALISFYISKKRIMSSFIEKIKIWKKFQLCSLKTFYYLGLLTVVIFISLCFLYLQLLSHKGNKYDLSSLGKLNINNYKKQNKISLKIGIKDSAEFPKIILGNELRRKDETFVPDLSLKEDIKNKHLEEHMNISDLLFSENTCSLSYQLPKSSEDLYIRQNKLNANQRLEESSVFTQPSQENEDFSKKLKHTFSNNLKDIKSELVQSGPNSLINTESEKTNILSSHTFASDDSYKRKTEKPMTKTCSLSKEDILDSRERFLIKILPKNCLQEEETCHSSDNKVYKDEPKVFYFNNSEPFSNYILALVLFLSTLFIATMCTFKKNKNKEIFLAINEQRKDISNSETTKIMHSSQKNNGVEENKDEACSSPVNVNAKGTDDNQKQSVLKNDQKVAVSDFTEQSDTDKTETKRKDVDSCDEGILDSDKTVDNRTDIVSCDEEMSDTDKTENNRIDVTSCDEGISDTDKTENNRTDIVSCDEEINDIDKTENKKKDIAICEEGISDTDETEKDRKDIARCNEGISDTDKIETKRKDIASCDEQIECLFAAETTEVVTFSQEQDFLEKSNEVSNFVPAETNNTISNFQEKVQMNPQKETSIHTKSKLNDFETKNEGQVRYTSDEELGKGLDLGTIKEINSFQNRNPVQLSNEITSNAPDDINRNRICGDSQESAKMVAEEETVQGTKGRSNKAVRENKGQNIHSVSKETEMGIYSSRNTNSAQVHNEIADYVPGDIDGSSICDNSEEFVEFINQKETILHPKDGSNASVDTEHETKDRNSAEDESCSQNIERQSNRERNSESSGKVGKRLTHPDTFEIGEATDDDKEMNASLSQTRDVIYLQQGEFRLKCISDKNSNYTIKFSTEGKFGSKRKVKYLKYNFKMEKNPNNESAT